MRKLYFILSFFVFFNAFSQEEPIEEDKRYAAESIFMLGMKEYIAENYASAGDLFQKVIDGGTATAGVYHMLSRTQLLQNDLPNAAKSAKKALEMEKENNMYQAFMADIYAKSQDFEKAQDLYKKLIKNEPLKPENYIALAEIHESLAEYESAIKVYDQLEKNIGIEEMIAERKQALYLRQNKVSEAIKEGNKLIDNQPLEPDYVLKQAQILIGNQKYDEAELLLNEALKKNGEFGEAHIYLAEIYRQKGDMEASNSQIRLTLRNADLEGDIKQKIFGSYLKSVFDKPTTKNLNDAEQLAQEFATANPKEAAAHLYLGDILMKKGELSRAKDSYLKSLDFDKSVFQVWEAVVEIDTKLSDTDGLIKHSTLAAEYFPNQAYFWYHSGFGNVMKGNYEEAVSSLEEALNLTFDNLDLQKHILLLLGDAYFHTKQYADSEEAFDKVLKLHPEDLTALNNASFYLATSKRKLAKAKELASRLIKLAPNNIVYIDTFAWVAFQSGNYEEAREVLEQKFLASDQKNIASSEHLGDIYAKLNNKLKALEYWKLSKSQGNKNPNIDKKIAQEQYIE